MIGSQFGMAGIFKNFYLKVLGRENDNKSVDSLLFGTFMGGYMSGFFAGPLELAMIQQQRFGMNLKNCTKKIILDFGIRSGLFRGTFNTSMREGI